MAIRNKKKESLDVGGKLNENWKKTIRGNERNKEPRDL